LVILAMSPIPFVSQESNTGTIFLACVGLIVLCLVGAALVLWVRRRLLAKSDAPTSAGFSLSDLRELHRTGKMSDEEFAKARDRMVLAAKRALERDAAATLKNGPKDGPKAR
jgi:hypothetical protein